MVVKQQKRALGTFVSQEEAEKAIKALNESGFPMDRISVIAKGLQKTDETPNDVEVSDSVNNTKVTTPSNIVNNTFALSATGVTLLGLTSLVLPFFGPVIAGGTLATALTATAASTGIAAMAANNLVKALRDLGIPESQAKVYSDRLQQGDILIMVDGTEEEIAQGETILHQYKIENWRLY